MYKIITPIVTVLNQHRKPDHGANKKVIDFLISGGMGDILVLGSTDELTEVDKQEKSDFFRFYAECTAGRVGLYAGTGSMNFQDTVVLSNEVYDMGYTRPMVVSLYYYGVDQEKLFIYYDTLVESVKGSLYIYNYPARTGCSITPSAVARLLEANPNITGFKDSVSGPNHTNLICLAAKGRSFDTYSGFDDRYLYNIISGGNGCTGGLSNLAPEIWGALVKATNDKGFHRSMGLSGLIHELMPLYDLGSNFSLLFKKVMNRGGLGITDKAVFPYNQTGDETFQRAVKLVDQVLEKLKALNSRQGQYSQ